MDCPVCRDLERAYDVMSAEYSDARSSACYPSIRKFAAVKNVDMERARYELEEHRLLCVATKGKIVMLPAKQETTPRLRQPAA